MAAPLAGRIRRRLSVPRARGPGAGAKAQGRVHQAGRGGRAARADVGEAAGGARPSGGPPAAVGERATARLVRAALRAELPAAAAAARGGAGGEGLHGPAQAGHLRRRARGVAQARQGIGSQMAAEVMRDSQRALDEQVREELKIGEAHATPLKEGWVTGASTAVGALIPVAPFLVLSGPAAAWTAFAVAMLSHFAVGAA